MSGRPNTKMWQTMVNKLGGENEAREYYRNLGSKGGKASGTGGFYESRELAIRAGALGGAKSRRGFKLISETDTERTYKNNLDGSIETVKII